MHSPVLFVPGLPGTHLYERDPAVAGARGTKIFISAALFNPRDTARRREIIELLRGPDDLDVPDPVVAGDPIAVGLSVLGLDLLKRAKTLYEIVRGLGVEIEGFGWDWRRPVWDPRLLQRLAAKVIELADAPANATRQVTLIAHSTGGLVVRSLLEARRADPAFCARIGKVIAFGVPWAGTPQPVPFLIGERRFGLISAEVAQRILAPSWAAFDLLPPPHDSVHATDLSDAHGPLGFTTRGAQQVGLARETSWFGQKPTGPPDAALRTAMTLRGAQTIARLGRRSRTWDLPVELVNVIGWGEPTLVACELSATAGGGERLAITDDTSRDGDGTIPRRSVAWIQQSSSAGAKRVRTYHVPVGVYGSVERRKHSSLWRTPGGRELLARELTGAAAQRRLYAAADAEEANDDSGRHVTIHLHACDAHETALAGLAVRAFGANSTLDIDSATEPLGDGRYAVRVERSGMQRVPIGGNPKFRRFTIGVRWTGGGGEERFDFLVK